MVTSKYTDKQVATTIEEHGSQGEAAKALESFAVWAEEELKEDQLYINFTTLLRRYRRQAEQAEKESNE